MRRGGPVATYSAALLAAGVAAGAAAQAVAGSRVSMPWAQALLLFGALALASHLIVRFQVRDQVEALDLFEAVLAPTIVFFPGLAVVVLASAAKGTVSALHRNDPIKTAFNVAEKAASAGCGALVFALLASGKDVTGRNLGALGVAMVAVCVVNYSAFTGVLALAGGRSIREVLAGLRGSIVVGWVGGSVVQLAFGLLFVSTYEHGPVAVVVMAVPLVVLHWASRGFATARTDHVRLVGLQAATHALAGPVDPRDALPGFLAEVQRCFEADAVDLLEFTPSGLAIRHRASGETYWSGPDDGTSTAAALNTVAQHGALVLEARRDVGHLLSEEGWRVVAAAPVRTGERSFGVLCVYNRGGAEGFEKGEVVVLEALAGEVAGALDKAELLEGMLDERRRLADIVGNTSDGILTLDTTGAITSWNAGLAQITGHAAEGALGRDFETLLVPRDGNGEPVPFGAWPDVHEDLPGSVEVVTADRQSRWLSCTFTVVPGRDGRGPQLVVMARDVTRARELDKLKDDFVAVVSHELRTPLSPIKGWSHTLLKRGDELTPDQRREASRAILRQADRLEQLILNILEDSRIEHDVDSPTIVEDVIDAAASVRKVLDDFRTVAADRSILLQGAESPTLVAGRSVRIEQILVNLVSNAVKYSPKHEPIDVTVEHGPDAVLISVTDHGPGILEESRERVFERFERLADTPAQTGTGLGLYIARRLATSMGATLEVSAAVGGGSTFTLALRAVTAPASVSMPDVGRVR